MPLSWNEIRTRSFQFSKDWSSECSEHSEAKSFWDDFFHVFGVSRRRIASFEQHVKKIDGKAGYIDLLWKGVLLIEHKSRGKSLNRAHQQALDYFPGLKESELPRYIMVSDFARFRLYDLDKGTDIEFPLEELHKNIKLFGFIAGYQTEAPKEQDPVNIDAAKLMGKLHDKMNAVGYEGHALEVYLVRLLFCLFAEDTGIFERQQFQDYIQDKTSSDGTDLASHLSTLFQVLNTDHDKRLTNRDEHLAAFPYVNGKLFEEILPTAAFDSGMRQVLIDCCVLDWSRISPAIFGSLFQSIMDKETRRSLGAHYTSEANILKVINPLFMDNLRIEFEKARKNKNKLAEFHQKLNSLKFLDPACGCGNFLVIAYRELRLLELEVLRAENSSGQLSMDIGSIIQVDVDQFYGIEIEEFPAQIAQVALWLVDHQMNMLVSEEFGQYFTRIPLKASAKIVHGNALQLDWSVHVPIDELSFVMGNPPFIGKKEQSSDQKEDLQAASDGYSGVGLLDYVTGWYFKTALLCQQSEVECAFVSTNSITQGEQAPNFGGWMAAAGMRINFAHRTFNWSSEGQRKAAVHCIIIGFSKTSRSKKYIYEYENVDGEPSRLEARNINYYLADAPDIMLENRRAPVANVSAIVKGCEATDGGYLIFTDSEKVSFLKIEPEAKDLFRPFQGGHDLINGNMRWCLWLVDIPPTKIKNMKHVMERIESVKNFRLSSSKSATVAKAKTPSVFGEIRLSNSGESIAVPKVSSERRYYAPISFVPSNVVLNNTVQFIPNGTLYEFGIVQSTMHMAWMRAVAGRMKSDYQYSIKIVYNNFPWPIDPTDQMKEEVSEKAKIVLAVRSQFPESTLADLYDPLTMPPALLKAHNELEKTVDKSYGKKKFNSEAERVSFLFGLYQEYVGSIALE